MALLAFFLSKIVKYHFPGEQSVANLLLISIFVLAFVFPILPLLPRQKVHLGIFGMDNLCDTNMILTFLNNII